MRSQARKLAFQSCSPQARRGIGFYRVVAPQDKGVAGVGRALQPEASLAKLLTGARFYYPPNAIVPANSTLVLVSDMCVD